mmetsp:Transcript_118367/g.339741  ORF Transcript_118367/g.339741 Transcript_118367/m.339741 type:complete len:226 (+) Transcript_118367:814-1491(+)
MLPQHRALHLEAFHEGGLARVQRPRLGVPLRKAESVTDEGHGATALLKPLQEVVDQALALRILRADPRVEAGLHYEGAARRRHDRPQRVEARGPAGGDDLVLEELRADRDQVRGPLGVGLLEVRQGSALGKIHERGEVGGAGVVWPISARLVPHRLGRRVLGDQDLEGDRGQAVAKLAGRPGLGLLEDVLEKARASSAVLDSEQQRLQLNPMLRWPGERQDAEHP